MFVKYQRVAFNAKTNTNKEAFVLSAAEAYL